MNQPDPSPNPPANEAANKAANDQHEIRLLMALILAALVLMVTQFSLLAQSSVDAQVQSPAPGQAPAQAQSPERTPSGAERAEAVLKTAPDAEPPVVHAPRLVVDRDRIDLGDRKYMQPVKVEFTLGNAGDRPLYVQGRPYLEVVDGCCPPDLVIDVTTLKPGQSTHLSFEFSMHEGMGGKHLYRVYLKTNDPAQPERTLDVASNWIA
jgi:hypothetical protein